MHTEEDLFVLDFLVFQSSPAGRSSDLLRIYPTSSQNYWGPRNNYWSKRK